MNASRRAVWITGIGMVTPLGVDRDESWAGFRAGRSGIGPIRSYDASGEPVRIAGEVPESFEAKFEAATIPVFQSRFGRFTRLAMLASDEAIEHAALDPGAVDRTRIGVAMGVGGGPVHYLTPLEQALREEGKSLDEAIDHYFVVKTMFNAAAGAPSLEHRLEGPSVVNSAACASGAMALCTAAGWIESGRADCVLAGGADATVTAPSLLAYHRVGALTADNERGAAASRPFDAGRSGFVMAEGSAVMVLEAEDHARARGAEPIARLSGFAMTSEAYRIASPIPSGTGMARTMRMTLADAGREVGALGGIYAHAPSTQLGDDAEANAIGMLLGEDPGAVPVTAPKSMFGHAIGASSAIQAALGALSLRDGVLPPTLHLEEPDFRPALHVPGQSTPLAKAAVLCNAFGFGGHNCSLLLER